MATPGAGSREGGGAIRRGGSLPWIVVAIVAVGSAGLGRVPTADAGSIGSAESGSVVAETALVSPEDEQEQTEDYNPWQPCNERIF